MDGYVRSDTRAEDSAISAASSEARRESCVWANSWTLTAMFWVMLVLLFRVVLCSEGWWFCCVGVGGGVNEGVGSR